MSEPNDPPPPDDPEPDEPVPKIGRGPVRTLFPMASVVRIFALIVCLIAILALRKSCAAGVSSFITNFSPPATDAGPKGPPKP